MEKFDFFDRLAFLYNSKSQRLEIKNSLKALKCRSMEDFKNIEKNVYKYWQILNYYLFGIEWCKLELDFNKEQCTWFAFRIESFID